MDQSPHDFDRLLSLAVELRASGYSWAAVAKSLGEPLAIVRALPQQFAVDWSTAFEQAKRDISEAAALEGLAVLRTLLRSNDEKIRRDCAMKLASQLSIDRDALPRRSSDFHRIADYLEGLDHDELQTLLDREGTGNPESPA